MNRNHLSKKYIKGAGLEIGAGHNPWPLINPNTSCLYVDRFTRTQLLDHFPVESRENIPETDILADGFKLLPGVRSGTFDFVCNSHVLEHTPRPTEALDNWLYYLKPGGYLIMAVPDKSECFDRDRTVTDWYDLTETPLEAFKLRQYYDWFEHADRLHDMALQERVMLAQQNNEHIHFCVWDEPAMQEFFRRYIGDRMTCDLVEFEKAGHEFFIILRKK